MSKQGSDRIDPANVAQGSQPVARGSQPVAQASQPVPQGSEPVAQGFSPAQDSEAVAQGFSPAIQVRSAALSTILEHARAAAPDECCGILVGAPDEVDEAFVARNIAERPATRFLLDPRDHLHALRAARRRGADVVGFYHSHPRSAAVPSETDLAEASYSDHLFLIVGLASTEADVRLYRFTGGNFRPIALVTVP